MLEVYSVQLLDMVVHILALFACDVLRITPMLYRTPLHRTFRKPQIALGVQVHERDKEQLKP